MDKQYNALNEFLDECINEALQETTGKFQVGVDHARGVDYEQYEKSDRFKGFEEDKADPEGEKMKDYERPAPYKIYQRPLTAEETKNYKIYEDEMGRMGPLKPGQTRPSWNGYDDSIRGFDKTEEYSKHMKPRDDSRRSGPRDTSRSYTQTDENYNQDQKYKGESKPRSSSFDWAYTNKGNAQADPRKYSNVVEPKINPNIYQPPINNEVTDERWSYKPKFTNVEKPQSSHEDTTRTEKLRRYSEPTTSYKPDSTQSEHLRPQEKFQTYENLYSNKTNYDSKQDYNKEKVKPEPPKQETELQENKKEKPLHGKNTEEVKQELLKLRPPILDRAYWGALPPMGKVTPMKPPADTVVFTLNTGTPPCRTEEECRRTVREIQARHMGQGLGDIQYNFLVGGDGNLYEGRGWGYESGIKPDKQQGKSYNIAFIGNYQDNVNNIPPHMLGPVQDLVVWGNSIRLMTNKTTSAGEYKIQPKEE